jgi:hypothetical protein
LGCEMVAMRSQLSFYKESIRQKRQPRPRFHPAFRAGGGPAGGLSPSYAARRGTRPHIPARE